MVGKRGRVKDGEKGKGYGWQKGEGLSMVKSGRVKGGEKGKG